MYSFQAQMCSRAACENAKKKKCCIFNARKLHGILKAHLSSLAISEGAFRKICLLVYTLTPTGRNTRLCDIQAALWFALEALLCILAGPQLEVQKHKRISFSNALLT